ncbi:fungal cellulose binding domain-containing protein [Kalaharituber pfeilii]|nr:fungal cellulose binding domain-containing protein [Kalaharituber pfeilii]
MKFLTLAAATAALLQGAAAHYRFTSLIVNGQVTREYQYVRQNTNYNSPVFVDSIDLRCNAGGASGANTQTAEVSAGATIGFKMDQPVYHAGPLLVYISKAPSTAASYDGSGSWAKIYQIEPTISGSTIAWNTEKDTFTFKLPSSLAAGEYLVRIEQIALHSMPAQFYVSCGQIKVTGGGSAIPSGIRFPSGYSANHPGININIYWPPLTSYTMPGPAVWRG